MLPALRGYLAAVAGNQRYSGGPDARSTEIAPNAVRDHTGAWHQGDLVVLCPGAVFTGVVGRYHRSLARDGVRRVRLQMMQTAPLAERLTTAVADGDSLRYYPAYDLPARALLPPQTPVAARTRAQLLMVQRADGGLTIGDTHEYAEPFAFDVDSDAYDHLQARAEAHARRPHPAGPAPLGRRLQRGQYRLCALPPFRARARRSAGYRARGRGMTCAPAIAEETFR